MGIFDRFRAAAPSGTNGVKPDTSGQDATRLIDQGHALEAQGRLDEAMQCYLDAIRLTPNPARGHLNRGNVLLLQGDLQGALDAFRTALKHQPDYAGAYYNIGNALLGNKQPNEAAASYRRALEINPDYAEVHCSLGVALKELGQVDEAMARYRRALDIHPDFFEGHLNLGNAMHAMKHSEEAVISYRRALEIQPDFAEAYNCLGLALQDLEQSGSALDAFKTAIKHNPDYAEAYNNLGLSLQTYGQLDDAVASYRRAIEIKPDFAEAHNNLGIVLQDIGKLDDAMASYRLALSIKPDFIEAHCNLSIALRKLGQLGSSMVNCARALEINPDSVDAHCHMGNILTDMGQFDRAETSYLRALEIKPNYLEAHSNLLLALNYADSHAFSYCLDQARQYGRVVAAKIGARFSEWQCDVQPQRLRVGLVSGDLRKHPVGFFLEGLLAHIDPARIELIAYPTNPKDDDLTARIRPYFSAWHPLFGNNDEAAACQIHADAVHVLIDLSGHTGHSRLPVFAWKPAPVQVTWLGYFATTGVAEIDYLLADAVGVPENQQVQFTESVWYLPDTRLCFTAPNTGPPVSALPALTKGHLTFGCFQNLSKAGDNVLALWGKILAALPDATLRMQCKQLGEPAQVDQLLQLLQKYGIATTRVTTYGNTHRDTYLAAHADVDVILDTLPYPGGTTTCEALWMGVPTLTLAGDSLLARQGASLLTAAGLPDWIATNEDDYVAKAVAFASDLEQLAALRATLRQQVLASPLLDAPRFARNFEQALWGCGSVIRTGREVWKGHEMGIFDRFRAAAPSGTNGVKPDTSGQDVTRLIDEGHVLETQGRLDEAMQRYLEAIRLAPNPARGHLNRGNILLLQGDLQGALNAFRTALKHQPDYAGAYYNIGNALLGNKQPNEAAASYRWALEINPDYAEVHCSLGVALKELGQLDSAVASFRRALEINPALSEARNNLGLALQHYYNTGNLLLNAGKLENAVANFRRALGIEPNLADAHFNLGNALKKLGQNESAMASYQRALEIKPDYAEAHGSLGVVLHDLWKFEDEVASYRRALAIKPDFAEAHSNLGVTLKEQGKLAEAEASYRRALELQPDQAMFRVAQTFSLPITPQTINETMAIPVDFGLALEELSEWVHSSPANRVSFSEAVGSQQPFYLAYRPGNWVALLSRYGDLVVASHPLTPLPSDPKRKKIRLGIVSNYFRRHSVWDVVLRGILANLDRTRFEVLLYNMSHVEDKETIFAKSKCDVWRDFHNVTGFDGWLEAIKTDRPDAILYPEIGMDPMTCRLATRRLAPLQVASWGHPITTGLPTIDLYFSGELIEAPDADSHYREKLVRLPGTGCYTTPIHLHPEALPELEAELVKRSGVCFVIAQTPFKFDPADDELFANIAAAVGASTFIILNDPQFSWATEQLIARLNRAFRERDLDPEKHLLAIPWLPREKFYALLDLCDIYLDCPSFSGYTTAWQAVHRGLPVVTLEGKFMRQRLAAGLLRKIGMTDTIAASKDEYVAIAARLAAECRDPSRRAARRDELKSAAPQADYDVSVVSAFEQSVIDALAKRGRHFEFDNNAQRNSRFPDPNKE